jgi:DNA polymerase III gamma/tau subunit
VKNLASKDMEELLAWVLECEEIELEHSTVSHIITAAEGSPRKALVITDQIRSMDDPDEQVRTIQKAIYTAEEEPLVIQLARQLMKNDSWPNIAITIGQIQLEELDPETVRRGILGYMTKVMLNNTGTTAQRAAKVVVEFVDPWFDSPKPRMTLACWLSVGK